MSPSSRRFIAGLVRVGLVVLAIVFVSGYFARKMPHKSRIRVQTEVPSPEALGPGDMRIYNADSSVDLILVGDKILAGLSPKTIAKIQGGLEQSASRDTSGLGASISQMVKKSVAGAIGTHAVFPVSDIRDIRYENEQIVFERKDGSTHQLFGNTRVDGGKVSNTFRAEDAEKFIAAVKARMR
jgi:hypothetical protein